MAALAPLINADKMAGATKAEARVAMKSDDEHVAVIDVIGSLIPRNRGFNDGSGLRSYRTLAHQIEVAINDPQVLGIVLDIDSYGGTAQGCARIARTIREASLHKPIYANVDMNAYSAATWIASACSKVILADADAGVGSVGCIAMHREISRRAEIEGDTYTVKYWGDKKADYNPVAPLTDDLAGKLERSVATLGLAFATSVAQHRGLSIDDVTKMQAGCFYGEEAIKVGLADDIASFSETCTMVAEDGRAKKKTISIGPTASNTKGQGGNPMSIKEQFSALLAQDGGAEALAETLSEQGYVAQATMEQSIAEACGAVEADAKGKADEQTKASVAVTVRVLCAVCR